MNWVNPSDQVTVPQWKDCYLQQEVFCLLNQQYACLIFTYKQGQQLLAESHSPSSLNPQDKSLQSTTQLSDLQRRSRALILQNNEEYFRAYQHQASIVQTFYQMKVMEFRSKVQFCQIVSNNLTEDKQGLFLLYLEHAYKETVYLESMRRHNLKAQQLIMAKREELNEGLFETPQIIEGQVSRMVRVESINQNKIVQIYADVQDVRVDKARERLTQLAHPQRKGKCTYLLLGLTMGITLFTLALLIFFVIRFDLSIENHSTFSRDFPVWRGYALFVLFIWSLGVNIYCFQKYKVNYQLILGLHDHHRTSSVDIFHLACFFTLQFLVLFTIYLLQLTQKIEASEQIRPQYLALFGWCTMLGYLIIPFPILNHQNRLFILKSTLKAAASPFMGVVVRDVMIVAQWISLITPLRDLTYTVCYYTTLDLSLQEQDDNSCRYGDSIWVVLVVAAFAITFRILQCIRIAYDTRHQRECCSQPIGAVIRFCLTLASTIISFVYRDHERKDLLWLWIVVATVSTLYSYVWDLKHDWQLVTSCCQLRKYLTCGSSGPYVFIIFANLLMRCAWTLNVSPGIESTFGNRNLIILVYGTSEIIRRGVWNFLRIQRQQVKNCSDFKASLNLSHIESELCQGIAEDEKQKMDQEQHEWKEISSQFIQVIRQKINQRSISHDQYINQSLLMSSEETTSLREEIEAIKTQSKENF